MRWARSMTRSPSTYRSDGTADTYAQGDKVLIDVEFNGPVKVSGARNKVTLRPAVGSDSALPRDIREILRLRGDSERHGGETLRFTYTVVAADTDTDGLFVLKDTDGNNRVLFIQGATAPITHAVTGETADSTYRGLGTTGDPLHKVDGAKTSGDIGPRPSSATVNGDTITLTFDANLAAPADLNELRYYFFVLGAGGVGDDDKNDTQSPQAIVHGTDPDDDKLTLTLGAPARGRHASRSVSSHSDELGAPARGRHRLADLHRQDAQRRGR